MPSRSSLSPLNPRTKGLARGQVTAGDAPQAAGGTAARPHQASYLGYHWVRGCGDICALHPFRGMGDCHTDIHMRRAFGCIPAHRWHPLLQVLQAREAMDGCIKEKDP